MFLFLVICILLALTYGALKTAAIAKSQRAIAEYLQMELKEIKAMQKIPVKPLAYGWFDDGFPADPSQQEERGPLENPAPQNGADEYMTQAFIAEYKAMPGAHQLEKREANDLKWLRQEVIRSCDPFDDKDILKAAWEDPDEECRKVAQERVGALTNYVGVKPRKTA